MSNVAIRKHLAEYKPGDKGIYASDMNYLLSKAGNSADYTGEINQQKPEDKQWLMSKAGTDSVLIHLGFIWRNGRLCKCTDGYCALMSGQLGDNLDYTRISTGLIPIEIPDAESTMCTAGLSGSSAIWYVVMLSDDTLDTNADTFADWEGATHSSNPALTPNKYHVMYYTRDTIGSIYSGLPTHIDSCKKIIGMANWSEDGKLINIYPSFLKGTITEQFDAKPWDIFYYDKENGEIYVCNGNVKVGADSFSPTEFVNATTKYDIDGLTKVALTADTINYVYLEYDPDVDPPTADIINVVDADHDDYIAEENNKVKRLLWTISLSADYNDVTGFDRHISEDVYVSEASEKAMEFEFRVIKVDDVDTLQVYLLDQNDNNVYYNKKSITDNTEVLESGVTGAGWRGVKASVCTLPADGASISLYLFVKLKYLQQYNDFSANRTGDIVWNIVSSAGSSGKEPYEHPILLCTISNTGGVYSVKHNRLGCVVIDDHVTDSDSTAICTGGRLFPQRSLATLLTSEDTGQGSYQLYHFDTQTAITDSEADLNFVVTEEDSTDSIRQVAYYTMTELVAYIQSKMEIDCTDVEACIDAYVSSLDHNSLGGLQGGSADEQEGGSYYHLTQEQHDALTSIVGEDGEIAIEHNNLDGLQGGVDGEAGKEYYHLTEEQHTTLTGIVGEDGEILIDHNTLGGIQGGTTDEYYHLTETEYTAFTDTLDDDGMVNHNLLDGIQGGAENDYYHLSLDELNGLQAAFDVDNNLDHNLLTGLQGGTTGEYYHLTAAESTALAAGIDGGELTSPPP